MPLTDHLLLPLAPCLSQHRPCHCPVRSFFASGRQVHWYGVGYVVGILFGWWYAKRLLTNAKLWRDGKAPFGPEMIDDLLVYAALGIVLGGRIGYILFYDFQRYLANPLDIGALAGRHVVPRRFSRLYPGDGITGAIARPRCLEPVRRDCRRNAGGARSGAVHQFHQLRNCGVAPTDLPWAFVFPNAADRTRAIPASSTKHCWKGWSCLWCCGC